MSAIQCCGRPNLRALPRRQPPQKGYTKLLRIIPLYTHTHLVLVYRTGAYALQTAKSQACEGFGCKLQAQVSWAAKCIPIHVDPGCRCWTTHSLRITGRHLPLRVLAHPEWMWFPRCAATRAIRRGEERREDGVRSGLNYRISRRQHRGFCAEKMHNFSNEHIPSKL